MFQTGENEYEWMNDHESKMNLSMNLSNLVHKISVIILSLNNVIFLL